MMLPNQEKIRLTSQQSKAERVFLFRNPSFVIPRPINQFVGTEPQIDLAPSIFSIRRTMYQITANLNCQIAPNGTRCRFNRLSRADGVTSKRNRTFFAFQNQRNQRPTGQIAYQIAKEG